jgi:2,4-dienoyl-CoA reductase-like NADH-dependent reductase (Old Yellow Enzyme family)/thioredoxin reductase
MNNDFSTLFKPLEIGKGRKKLRLKNRLVMPPMVTCTANSTGEVTQRTVDYYVERARGGVGTIIVESMDVDDKMLFNRLGVFHDRFINQLNYLAVSIKENGARVFGQINETGIRGHLKGPDDLTVEEIEKLIETYAAAADRLRRAEFNGVEIHGAHGYLVNEFLSPLTNHRTDEYGGTLEKRSLFATKVISLVRKAVGDDFAISFRMNGDDYLDGGITIDQARFHAKKAEEAGADIIHVSGGIGISLHDISMENNKSYYMIQQPMCVPRGCMVHLAEGVKKAVNVPVITVGRINDPYLARDIITGGKADLVAMGRALIADPYLPRKIAEGRMEDIRQCIGCMNCHGKSIRLIKQIRCALNPWAGREAEVKNVKKADAPKNVMIAGGGPAGMEAARWLKRRGHHVTLYEKSDRLGGQLMLACLPPFKSEIDTFRKFLVRQMGTMNIEIKLMAEVTPELVLRKKPDELIMATGASMIKPSFAIDEKMKRVYAVDVFSGKGDISGSEFVVLGGNYMAAETAEFITAKGKHVTIIGRRGLIAFDMEALSRQLLIQRLEKLGVVMVTRTQVEEVTAERVIAKDLDDGSIRQFPADTVVIALGSEPAGFPVEEIEKAGVKVHFIGDSKEVHGIAEATRDGFLAGTTI